MKRENKTGYYVFLVSLIGDQVVSTKDLYGLVDKADKNFSIVRRDRSRHCAIVKELQAILGENLSSIDDPETKMRGRGKAQYFSLSGGLEAVSTKIRDYYKDLAPMHEESVVKATKLEEVEKKSVPHKKMVMNIYHLLKASPAVELDKAARILGCKKGFSKSMWKNQTEYLKKYSVLISYYFTKKDREEKLIINDPNNALLTLQKKIKEWYGMEIVEKEEKPEEVKVEEKEEPEHLSSVYLSESEYRSYITRTKKQNYILFVISALIKRGGFRAIELDDACKFIRQEVQVSGILNKDIYDLIKTEPNLTIANNKLISLTGGEEGWKRMKDKYAPTLTHRVVARIGLGPEELRKLTTLKFDVESKIAESDNIYVFYLHENSRVDFRNLMEVYRTFRGNDKILGNPNLVRMLNSQIVWDEDHVRDEDVLYQLEKV